MLIVRSRVLDPQRSAGAIKREEEAWKHFKELKDLLPKTSSHWEKDFKSHVDKFIAQCLKEKEDITSIPCNNEEEEEWDRIDLHRLRRLVAGAFQEWELVQQPMPAAACAKLDGALVWQGRGYVTPVLNSISSFQPFLQCQFEKVSKNVWLVMPKFLYKSTHYPLLSMVSINM
jgi:hypothetical protein